MTPFIYILLFIFGLTVGSFLNVVIFRYQPGKKVLDSKLIGGPGNWKARSRCMSCEKNLAWYELLPLASFLTQKGKCRGCGAKISFQYFLIELLSGATFVFVPMFWAASLPLMLIPEYISMFLILSFIWILIFLALIVLSAIDFRHFIIPDSMNVFLAVLGIVLLAVNYYYERFSYIGGSFFGYYADLFGLRENIWVNYFFAVAIVMIFFGLIIVLSRGKGMGWGDFKLAGALGLILGWPDILGACFLAFIIGLVFSLVFVAFHKKKMKDIIPFGPFLALGASLVFFFGHQLMSLYFKLFGL
ncbi:MAG: prepilin peptidase [Spirochaetota bacterium]